MRDSVLPTVRTEVSDDKPAYANPRTKLANLLLPEIYHAGRHPEQVRRQIIDLESSARDGTMVFGLAHRILDGVEEIATVPEELKEKYTPPSGTGCENGKVYLIPEKKFRISAD